MRAFTALDLDQHFDWRGETLWLHIPADLMKTDRSFECPIPDDLAEAIGFYVEHFRPLLAAQGARDTPPGSRLWVSTEGRAMTENSLGYRILAETKRAFGVGINPHMFRDALATIIAEADSAHVHMAAAILGHTSLATTERYYNHAKSTEACHHLHEAIAKLRKK